MRIARMVVPVVLDAQHRDALLGGDALAQLLVPAGDVAVQVVQPQCQVDLPAGRVFHGEGRVIPLIAKLASHAPGAPLVAIVQAGDVGPAHDPPQQGHHVLRGEVAAGEHHHIQLTPAHQPGDIAPGDQQRADIGD